MTKQQLEKLILAARKYKETLNFHIENPLEEKPLKDWDIATSEFDNLINGDELNIILSLIEELDKVKLENITIEKPKEENSSLNPALWVDEPLGDDEWSKGGRAMRNAISQIFKMKN